MFIFGIIQKEFHFHFILSLIFVCLDLRSAVMRVLFFAWEKYTHMMGSIRRQREWEKGVGRKQKKDRVKRKWKKFKAIAESRIMKAKIEKKNSFSKRPPRIPLWGMWKVMMIEFFFAYMISQWKQLMICGWWWFLHRIVYFMNFSLTLKFRHLNFIFWSL